MFNSRQEREAVFHASTLSLGLIQSPIQWVPWAHSPRLKRTMREADHSAPSSTEGKNKRIYSTTTPYVFMEWCLIKHKDSFTVYIVCKCTL
jgi:hypothetical protein